MDTCFDQFVLIEMWTAVLVFVLKYPSKWICKRHEEQIFVFAYAGWRLSACGSMNISARCGGGSNWKAGEKGSARSEKEKREVSWPLVAFTTQAQIIEGHGNRSDRWTMLLFSSPLWTGPSITGGEINSIHQLFVSLGPLILLKGDL